VSRTQPSVFKAATTMLVPPSVMLGTPNVSPSVGSIHLLAHPQQLTTIINEITNPRRLQGQVASTNLKPNAIEQIPISIKIATIKATTKPSTTKKKLQMELNLDSLEILELGENDIRSHSTPNKEDGCESL
jgi:hypothetical protein